jgi:cell wall-associated NlpC family hydrolase
MTALIACALPREGASAAPHPELTSTIDASRAARVAHATAKRAAEDRRARARARVDGVVEAAAAQIGDGYAYGGSGPDGFDCSGLTAFAFADAGVGLPHNSHGQAAMGEPVARSDIRPGDLVFFSTAGPGASHVGVATSSTTVISATVSGGVMEHSTTDAYWGGHYVGARRIL